MAQTSRERAQRILSNVHEPAVSAPQPNPSQAKIAQARSASISEQATQHVANRSTVPTQPSPGSQAMPAQAQAHARAIGERLTARGVSHNTPSHEQPISPSPSPSRPTPNNTPTQGRSPSIER